jgi:hypothetical protein
MSFHLFSHHPKKSGSNSPQIDATDGQEEGSVHSNKHASSTPKRSDGTAGLLHPKPTYGHRTESPNRTDSPESLAKFRADPFRSSPRPEHLGDFQDPMGGSINQSTEKDPMSTGA